MRIQVVNGNDRHVSNRVNIASLNKCEPVIQVDHRPVRSSPAFCKLSVERLPRDSDELLPHPQGAYSA